MKKTILVSADRGETRVAVLESKTKGGKRNVAPLYVELRDVAFAAFGLRLEDGDSGLATIGGHQDGFLHVCFSSVQIGTRGPVPFKGSPGEPAFLAEARLHVNAL